MEINSSNIDLVVQEVVKAIKEKINNSKNKNTIPVEASGRHIHLSRQHVDLLFGKDYELKFERELSQPGQYLCKEKVTLRGAKGKINNVAILGPVRNNTQVEISKTDARILGINAPVRESGDISNSSPIIIVSDNVTLSLKEGAIIAKRHIHITPEDAERFNVMDRELVGLQILSDRSTIFGDVVVRVSKNFKTSAHIDYDEANSCSFMKNIEARIIKWERIVEDEKIN
ncbi:ethanolamine utilization phosphate acetyltransferase EutD [Clostridium sediminicola]|uniref:phosphate propanoyltransferase n=1 Tax=Clostridium sediminicola TaxID=3114879 RepID=UPI0031F25D36